MTRPARAPRRPRQAAPVRVTLTPAVGDDSGAEADLAELLFRLFDERKARAAK